MLLGACGHARRILRALAAPPSRLSRRDALRLGHACALQARHAQRLTYRPLGFVERFNFEAQKW